MSDHGYEIDPEEPRSSSEEPDTDDRMFIAETDFSDSGHSVTSLLNRQRDEDEEVVINRAMPSRKRRLRLSPTPAPTPPARFVVDSDSEVEEVAPTPRPQAKKKVRTAGHPAESSAEAPSAISRLSKLWTCTWNNYPPLYDLLEEKEFSDTIAKEIAERFIKGGIGVNYLCAGKERAETGTRHLQMFIHFTEKRRKTALVKVVPELYYVESKGTAKQNRDYCSGLVEKKGMFLNPFFSEYGTCPVEGSTATKEKWSGVLNMVKVGNFDGIAEIDPRFLMTQYRNLEYVHRKLGSAGTAKFVNPVMHTGIWIWSKRSGAGKTLAVHRQWPNPYQKAHDEQWNDYDFEPVALLDDFSRSDALKLHSALKLWTSHLPFHGRILYGTVKVHLQRFVVTSNYSIEDLFAPIGAEVYGPIAKRFRVFNWDDGISWQDRPTDVFSEENLAKVPLGNTFDERLCQ